MVSSRLTAYLKRPWTSFAPCPIEKELLETHPRRTYFYLSIYPHQPIPETSNPAQANRIISPSLSSATGEDEEDCGRESRARVAPSPSPEIDLSAPDLAVEEDVRNSLTPAGSFSAHAGTLLHDVISSSADIAHNRRAASPPLERDEREFEQTASSLQKRKQLNQLRRALVGSSNVDVDVGNDGDDGDDLVGAAPAVQPPEDTEESVAMRSSQAAVELFGPGTAMAIDITSPVMRPQGTKRYSVGGGDMEDVRAEGSAPVAAIPRQERDKSLEASWQWAESCKPELIGVDELDEMFGGY